MKKDETVSVLGNETNWLAAKPTRWALLAAAAFGALGSIFAILWWESRPLPGRAVLNSIRSAVKKWGNQSFIGAELRTAPVQNLKLPTFTTPANGMALGLDRWRVNLPAGIMRITMSLPLDTQWHSRTAPFRVRAYYRRRWHEIRLNRLPLQAERHRQPTSAGPVRQRTRSHLRVFVDGLEGGMTGYAADQRRSHHGLEMPRPDTTSGPFILGGFLPTGTTRIHIFHTGLTGVPVALVVGYSHFELTWGGANITVRDRLADYKRYKPAEGKVYGVINSGQLRAYQAIRRGLIESGVMPWSADAIIRRVAAGLLRNTDLQLTQMAFAANLESLPRLPTAGAAVKTAELALSLPTAAKIVYWGTSKGDRFCIFRQLPWSACVWYFNKSGEITGRGYILARGWKLRSVQGRTFIKRTLPAAVPFFEAGPPHPWSFVDPR